MLKAKIPRRRSEALKMGERYYLTGKPCKRGHLAWRITENGACTKCAYECQMESRRKFRAKLKAIEASKKGK